jgi:hypothetical protein
MKSGILASILVVACVLSPTQGATTPLALTLEAQPDTVKAGSPKGKLARVLSLPNLTPLRRRTHHRGIFLTTKRFREGW